MVGGSGSLLSSGPTSSIPFITAARTADGQYDFRPVFAYLKPRFAEADAVIVNLETTLSPEPPFSGYPCFRTPASMADALRDAGVDMAVLAKCLRAYGITWRARAQYIDTVRMARAAFPELPNHKLDTLSYALGIDLAHHDAGSDALACAKIFLACRERGVSPGRFTREYDLLTVSTVKGGTARV